MYAHRLLTLNIAEGRRIIRSLVRPGHVCTRVHARIRANSSYDSESRLSGQPGFHGTRKKNV